MARTHLSVIQGIDRALRELPDDAKPAAAFKALAPLRALLPALLARGAYRDFVDGTSSLGRAYRRVFKRHEARIVAAVDWELGQRRTENEKRNRRIEKDMARVIRGMEG